MTAASGCWELTRGWALRDGPAANAAPPDARSASGCATRGTSISPVIYALVERGVLLRPALAVELRGSILMRLGDP